MVLTWEPISDLPQDWSSLTDGELGPLLLFWNDQRTDLEQSGALVEFNKRLGREWSIETGQIEGVYNLDRGTTETLIERGFNADLIPNQPGQKLPELIAAIIQDHADVLEGLFQFVKGDRSLSKSYIHELHAALLRHQDTTIKMTPDGRLFEAPLLKGKYKQQPNNPRRPDGSVHKYSPPEQVEPEMEHLLALHREHAKRTIPVEVEAAWLHHRFTQIHPYEDGNGRVARALASLLFIKSGWFPVVVSRDYRVHYIDALEAADNGDLRFLISFLVDMQKRALLQSIEPISESVKATSSRDKPLNHWIRTIGYADRLRDVASERLEKTAGALRQSDPAYEFGTLKSDPSSWADVSEILPYKPNLIAYEKASRLTISARRRPYTKYIEVVSHAVGPKFLGLISFVVVFWKGIDGSKGIAMASRGVFQVNYAESYESAERRFRPWLEDSLANALTLWRKSL
jgi:hypothetical protein